MSRDPKVEVGQQPVSNMLERAVHILQAYRPDGGTLSLPTLIRRTGLPKATTYRLAEQLVLLGLLERRPKGYCPGVGLFELGELAPAKTDLTEIAMPFMQDLYEATHQTVHLGIREGFDVVYAEKIRGHGAVAVPSRVGRRLPLSSTGVGKALLAFAEPSIIDAVLSRPLRPLTDRSVTDPVKLAAELANIRKTGIAYDREEAAPGVMCVAAPILVNTCAVAALSITFAARLQIEAGLAPALRAISLALSRRLASSTAG